MPKVIQVLKDEIARISRRETKKANAVLERSSAAYRRDIAALKRQLKALERAQKALQKQTTSTVTVEPKVAQKASHRFSAQGFRTLRHRLGLSAAQFGTLFGVTEQSIYNWETKVAKPRALHLPLIAKFRGMGKREVASLMEQAKAKSPRRKK